MSYVVNFLGESIQAPVVQQKNSILIVLDSQIAKTGKDKISTSTKNIRVRENHSNIFWILGKPAID